MKKLLLVAVLALLSGPAYGNDLIQNLGRARNVVWSAVEMGGGMLLGVGLIPAPTTPSASSNNPGAELWVYDLRGGPIWNEDPSLRHTVFMDYSLSSAEHKFLAKIGSTAELADKFDRFSEEGVQIQHGVRAAEVEIPVKLVEAEVELNGDALRLNISESGVVRDEAYEAAMTAVPGLLRRLVRAACQSQKERYAAVGTAVSDQGMAGAALRARLRMADRPDGGWLDLAMASVAEASEEDADLLRFEAAAAWLREGMVRGRSQETLIPGDLAEEMNGTPLFLSVTGKTLRLRDVEALDRWLGWLPVSKSIFPDSPLLVDPVWCPTKSAASCLERLFPGHIQWLSDLEVCRGPLPARR